MPAGSRNIEVRMMFACKILTEQKPKSCRLCHYGHYMCEPVVLQRVIIIFQREHHFNKFHTKSYNHDLCYTSKTSCNLHQLALIFQYDGTN